MAGTGVVAGGSVVVGRGVVVGGGGGVGRGVVVGGSVVVGKGVVVGGWLVVGGAVVVGRGVVVGGAVVAQVDPFPPQMPQLSKQVHPKVRSVEMAKLLCVVCLSAKNTTIA